MLSKSQKIVKKTYFLTEILTNIKKSNIDYIDFTIKKRSLEGIFVDFIKKKND